MDGLLKRFVVATALAALLASFQPTLASADSGSRGPRVSPIPVTGVLHPNQRFNLRLKDPVTCTGFSVGGASGPMSAWGQAYMDCEGTVYSQYAEIHVVWCVATIVGCNPFVDQGIMTGGSGIYFGPGGFWTPTYGSATMGGLTPGYSYMIFTNHRVTDLDGSVGTGSSTSSIFRLPLP